MEMKASEVHGLPWEDDFESSNVRRVAFVVKPGGIAAVAEGEEFPVVGTLYVQFNGNEKLYAYGDVTEAKAKELVSASSVGSYLNAEIKGVHPVEVVVVSEADAPGRSGR